MKKVELEEIAPYIAYELNIEILNFKSDNVGIQYSKLNGYYMLSGQPYFTYEGGSTGKSFSEFNIFLKPLNDITKPQLKRLQDIFILSNMTVGTVYKKEILKEITLHNVNSLPHKAVQYLIELHYDIFGLIPKGFAKKLK